MFYVRNAALEIDVIKAFIHELDMELKFGGNPRNIFHVLVLPRRGDSEVLTIITVRQHSTVWSSQR